MSVQAATRRAEKAVGQIAQLICAITLLFDLLIHFKMYAIGALFRSLQTSLQVTRSRTTPAGMRLSTTPSKSIDIRLVERFS